MSEQANFSASDQLGRNFPTVQNGPEKRKNLYLIKLVSKWKRTIWKGHTSVLVFHFWDLELALIDSALNSASVNFNLRFLKCRNGTKKTSQIWKCRLKFFGNVSCDLKPQNWEIFEPNFCYRKLTRDRVDEIVFVKFWSFSFDFWSHPFHMYSNPSKNFSNSVFVC